MMRWAPHLLPVGACLIVLATTFLNRRRKSIPSRVLEWRGCHGLRSITLTSKELRLYRSWWPERRAHDDPNLGLRYWRWPFSPFSNARASADTTYCAWGGLLFARGENAETRTRYRVVSIPHWLPLLIAIIALVPSALYPLLSLPTTDR
jgi:hypothetical protein